MAGTFVSDTIQNGAGATVPTTTVINGSAKAWVNYNGVAQTIRSSFNVSSVTYNATGNYTINYTTAFADTNYVTLAASSAWYATQWNYGVSINTSSSSATQVAPTTTSTRIFQYSISGAYDPVYVSFAAFGN
jgi:hypothetical protein